MMLVEDMLVAAADGQRAAGVSSADLFFLSSSASFGAMQAEVGTTVAGHDNDDGDGDVGDDGGGGGVVKEEISNAYGCAHGQGGTVSWSACEDRVGLHHITTTTNTTATPHGGGLAATIDGGCSRTARLTSRPFFADDGDAPQPQPQQQQPSFVMDGGAWDSWIASLSTTQSEVLFALQATTVEDGFSLPTNQQTPASASASSASTLASFSWRLDDSPTSTAASMEPSTPTTPSWARATVGEVFQQQQQQHEAAPPTKKGNWPWQSMLDATAALSTASKDERCFECGWTLASALSAAEGSSHGGDEGKLRILSRHPALQANDAGRTYLCSRCARSDKYELLSTKEAQRRFRLKRKGASELLRQVPHIRVGSSKKYWVHHLQWVADCSQALAGPDDDDVIVDGAEDVAKAAHQPATKQRQQQNDDSTKRKKRARTASAQHHGAAASPWEMALAMSGVIMPVTLTMSGSCSQAPVSHQDPLPREQVGVEHQQQQDNDDEAARAEAFLAQFRYTDLFGHLEAACWAAPSFDWPSTGESDCLGLIAESMSVCAPPPHQTLADAVGGVLEDCEASCTSTPLYTDDNGPGDEEDSDSEDSEDVLSAHEVKQRAAQRKVELDQIRRDVRLEHLFSAMKRLDRGPCHADADADADADAKCNDDDEDSDSNGNDRSTTHEEMFDWISSRAGAQHLAALHAFVAGRWKELDERCGGMGPCEVERMAAYLSHNPLQPQQEGPAAAAPTDEDGPLHYEHYHFETQVALH